MGFKKRYKIRYFSIVVLRAVDEYGIISDEVPVAQWIERVPPEHETAGSSPVGDALVLLREGFLQHIEIVNSLHATLPI